MYSLNKEKDALKDKEKSFQKPEIPGVKYKSVTAKCFLVFGTLVTIYGIIYIPIYLLSIPGSLMAGLASFFANTDALFFEKILYNITIPIIWIPRWIMLNYFTETPLLFSMQPKDVGLYHLAEFIFGIAALAIILLAIALIIDIPLYIIKKPILIKKNKNIRHENMINCIANIALVDMWKESDDFIKRNKKIKQIQVEINEYDKQINNCRLLHKDYKKASKIDILIDYYEKGRASSLEKAINLMHKEEIDFARLRIEQKAAEYQKQSMEYQKQAARDAKVASEVASNALNEAGRASELAASNLGATLGLASEIDKMNKQ